MEAFKLFGDCDTESLHMGDALRITKLLAEKPGLKVQQIASELGLERSEVVTTLHGLAGSGIVQDSQYRWWPKPEPASGAAPALAPRLFLASLCRYYLECLARESGAGVSLSADDGGYVELAELPFAGLAHERLGGDRAVKRLVQKVRRERGQLTL